MSTEIPAGPATDRMVLLVDLMMPGVRSTDLERQVSGDQDGTVPVVDTRGIDPKEGTRAGGQDNQKQDSVDNDVPDLEVTPENLEGE